MDKFLTWVERTTEKRLTLRKARRAYAKNKKRTFLSEALEWLDALELAPLYKEKWLAR